MLLENYSLDMVMTWMRTHYFGKYAGKVVATPTTRLPKDVSKWKLPESLPPAPRCGRCLVYPMRATKSASSPSPCGQQCLGRV